MKTIQIDTKRLVGLTEIQASKLIAAVGGYVNIMMINGIPVGEKTDMRTDRVNLEIRGERVTRAYIG